MFNISCPVPGRAAASRNIFYSNCPRHALNIVRRKKYSDSKIASFSRSDMFAPSSRT